MIGIDYVLIVMKISRFSLNSLDILVPYSSSPISSTNYTIQDDDNLIKLDVRKNYLFIFI